MCYCWQVPVSRRYLNVYTAVLVESYCQLVEVWDMLTCHAIPSPQTFRRQQQSRQQRGSWAWGDSKGIMCPLVATWEGLFDVVESSFTIIGNLSVIFVSTGAFYSFQLPYQCIVMVTKTWRVYPGMRCVVVVVAYGSCCLKLVGLTVQYHIFHNNTYMLYPIGQLNDNKSPRWCNG
jgi:hypothetical protein